MQIKIATWNLGYWQHRSTAEEAWNYLLNEIAPDIALVQEARIPENGITGWHSVWCEIGGSRRWGSGVLAKDVRLDEVAFGNSYPGALTVADAHLRNGTILTVASIYGLIDQWGYSITTLHRMLSDLTPLLAGRLGKRQWVVGGDLNASIQFDERQSDQSHRILFERLQDFGLINSHFLFHDDHWQTLRHKGSTTPWQNDYILVSQALEGRVSSYRIEDLPVIHPLSDHNPVIITLSV